MNKPHRIYQILLGVIFLIIVAPCLTLAQTKRVVIIKVDGLSQDMLDQFVQQTNPRTNKRYLPWISLLFYEQGTRIKNFYVRGISVSAPSWSMLDTGQPSQIKGNIEFDRLTLQSRDFLNFVSFYLNNAVSHRVDTLGVELLDGVGVPLLLDAYEEDERYQGVEIYQRGVKWSTLDRAFKNPILTYSPKKLLDEWTIGLSGSDMIADQFERELIAKLDDPNVKYLDYFNMEIDHVIHRNNDRNSQMAALEKLDAVVGRIWSAIQKSSLGPETALIMLSDHGSNTDEKVYSQGYNLVELLASATGGGHHVVTKITPTTDYTLKGLNPLSPNTTTTASESYYLKGRSADYPTALLDFDGNERASVFLRNSDFNVLQILLQQLARKDLSLSVRSAATDAFFQTINKRRSEWTAQVVQLQEELAAADRAIRKEQIDIQTHKKRLTAPEPDAERDKETIRRTARLNESQTQQRAYAEFAQALSNLLALRRETFSPSTLKIEDVIPKRAMGEQNSIYELQNYVVGLAPAGLVLSNDGSLDLVKSFVRIDYYTLFSNVAVRNNVQRGIDSHPVDFIATKIPRPALSLVLQADELPTEDAIWLYGGNSNQALILPRRAANGQLSLRYLPVMQLRQESDGTVSFAKAEWRPGLPLKLFEDSKILIPAAERAQWLSEWHTELEWLQTTHLAQYSNAIIGLQEFFEVHLTEKLDPDRADCSNDDRLLNRFRLRQREMVMPDMLLLANNHWNFHSRGFNPGGNHGSFFRMSTHSTLMFAGGDKTGIPRGAVVEQPYDSLSFVPTILKLTGQLPEGVPSASLRAKGFRAFPGRIIDELFSTSK